MGGLRVILGRAFLKPQESVMHLKLRLRLIWKKKMGALVTCGILDDGIQNKPKKALPIKGHVD